MYPPEIVMNSDDTARLHTIRVIKSTGYVECVVSNWVVTLPHEG